MDGDKILEEVKVFGALNAQMEQLVSLENEFLRGATARIPIPAGSDRLSSAVVLLVPAVTCRLCSRLCCRFVLCVVWVCVCAAIDQQKKLLLARHLAASKPRPPPSMLVPPASVTHQIRSGDNRVHAWANLKRLLDCRVMSQ